MGTFGNTATQYGESEKFVPSLLPRTAVRNFQYNFTLILMSPKEESSNMFKREKEEKG
jgi:hypothetical protein